MKYSQCTNMVALLFTVGLLFACSSEPDPVRVPPQADSATDELSILTERHLDKELEEISGLDNWAPGQLIAMHDEAAELFVLDILTGDIVQTFAPFPGGNSPDCEGVAVVDEHVYVITSSGKLYCARVEADTLTSVYADRAVGLRTDVNFEGLCYDKRTQQLLVVAKAAVPIEHARDKEKKKKSNKSDDLTETRMLYKLSVSGSILHVTDSLELQVGALTEESREEEFSPSGIDVDSEGNYTVIAARGHMMASFNDEGEVVYVVHLNKKALPQPEGIVWLDDETLAIASEGAGSKPVLVTAQKP